MNISFMTKTAAIALCLATVVTLYAKSSQDHVMKVLADNTYVVNTTTLCPTVNGFKSTTPVEIYIKKNKIVKIETLPNSETPRFFSKVKRLLLPKYSGQKVTSVMTKDVDGVSGATYSSKAIKKNVAAGLAYYKAHK